MSDERRAEKSTGAFFKDDHVARFGLELFLDLECLGIDLHTLAIGRMDRARFRFFTGFGGCIKDRYFQRSRQGKQLLRRFDRVVRINTARALVGIDKFVGLFGAAFISEIIKVNGQKCRSLADKGFTMIRRVGF